MRKKIAFIKKGSFSQTNVKVAQQLLKQFPEYELETIDLVDDILRPNPWLFPINLFHVFRLYGADIARRKRTLRQCYFRTPFIFHQIKLLVKKQLGKSLSDYAFSFQTQSLYDACVDGLPHFVYTDHTHLANLYYPGFNPANLFSKAWIDLEGIIYQRATKTFTMSRHVQRSLIDHYHCDPSRMACVFVGANADIMPINPENNNYTNKNILFVGLNWQRKGGPELAEAFRLVLRQHPDARLVIVGCSPRVDLPNCEIAGFIPLERVNHYYAKASLFCLPTKLEPFGIVFVEAFLHKLPVVATNIGALPDFIEEGKSGRLVTPGNVPELAAALNELLSDPDKCRRFGERGYDTVRQRYSWDAVGTRIREEITTFLK